MKNYAPILRFSIFNSFVLFIIAYGIYFYNIIGLLWEYDPTRFSFIITAIYFLTTIYIGIKGNLVDYDVVHFISARLTSIGLVGTVIGIMMLMHTVGTSNLTNLTEVIAPLFKGMSTLLITTLFGMLFSLLLDFQMAFIFRNSIANDES